MKPVNTGLVYSLLVTYFAVEVVGDSTPHLSGNKVKLLEAGFKTLLSVVSKK